jgi:DNA-binding response OmpR family regulator
MRVLIFGEHKKLNDIIERGLAAEDHDVRVVADGADAHRDLERWATDVVVIAPCGAPARGCDLCQRLRRAGVAVPVLMLGVAPDEDNPVAGMAMGPDLTLDLPFAFDDLIHALEALAKGRPPMKPDADVLLSGDLRFDRQTLMLTSRGQALKLSHKELTVLEVLLTAPGRSLSRREIVCRIWASPVDPPGSPVETLVECINQTLADVHSNMRVEVGPGATREATRYALMFLSRSDSGR